ncbi:hypothetical protein CG747_22180 [Streptomyces sp. CB02959]|nr:hypothetical protein CG747_22180 [Streptomyces sp. CB02959]
MASLLPPAPERRRRGPEQLRVPDRGVPTAKPKTAHKKRLHLDLAGGPDWETEVARLLTLGATRVDIGQGDVPGDGATCRGAAWGAVPGWGRGRTVGAAAGPG